MNWPNRTRGFSGVSFLFGATDVFLYLFFLLGRQSLTILTHEVCCLDGMGQTHRIKVHRILDGLSPKKWGKFKASTSTMDLKLAILPTLQLRGAGMAISLQSFDLICQETWEGGMLNGSFLRMIFGTVAMASWWVSVMYGYVLWLGQCKVRIRTLGRLASNMFCSFWWHCGWVLDVVGNTWGWRALMQNDHENTFSEWNWFGTSPLWMLHQQFPQSTT